ncbi:hypothetical protein NQ314_020827 [Rhamnusium bicolor]|uniref:Transcription termination factor 5, mitochondrial n=1 Tax=Rhamnusium bicolor TaxID=1586634 RepID=A0AAV8WJN5_9CUCU|nr:hypothetical protein NQ314_020827 [Rhamnusium bicolor]
MFKNNTNLCYKCCTLLNFRKFLSNCNSQILSDIFGMPRSRARIYIDKHKLQHRNGELLINSIQFCKKLGYTNEDILGTPSLLNKHPLELEQHYLSMEEGGFQSIGPNVLSRARIYMKKVINNLKIKNLICKETDVYEHFLKYIEDTEIVKKIPIISSSDDHQWNEVHMTILQSFLKWRLNATEDEIIKLFRIYKMIRNKSFRIIQENIALVEDIGFDRRKILKYGYLLHNFPNYTKTVLKDFPNLAGADMKKAMRQYPKLIMTSPTNILKIYGILKEFNIEDEIIRKQMNIFHMSPETVKLRLEEINHSPDFKVLLKHPRVLSLVVHHNRAKSRLSFLQQLQLKCASLIVLGTHRNEVFDDYIREGKDVNKSGDVVTFLKNTFNVDAERIRKKINCHPYYLQVPLKDMQDSYDYLISQHFRVSNIFKVMHVILYPVDKIANALKDIKVNKEINYKSLNQVKKLNLILYYIEKEHHFTGNGIWRKCDIDIPEKTLE